MSGQTQNKLIAVCFILVITFLGIVTVRFLEPGIYSKTHAAFTEPTPSSKSSISDDSINSFSKQRSELDESGQSPHGLQQSGHGDFSSSRIRFEEDAVFGRLLIVEDPDLGLIQFNGQHFTVMAKDRSPDGSRALEASLEKAGLSFKDAGPYGPFYFVFFSTDDPEEAYDRYLKVKSTFEPVAYVDLDELGQGSDGQVGNLNTAVVPNDPDYSSQWYHETIRTEVAWAVTTGSPDIIVAVLDSGIDDSLKEFEGRVLPGRAFLDAGATESTDIIDDHNHGTTVSAVIGAKGNNGEGIAGMNWNCKLLPVRVLKRNNDGGTLGFNSDWAKGVNYAVSRGAHVINMSFGSWTEYSALRLAVQNARQLGVVTIASMGNDSSSEKRYPAAFGDVIAVGATERDDDLTNFSNWGDHIDVVAPGLDIVTIVRGGAVGYGYLGTTYSTSIIAGLASLMLSIDPTLTPDEIRALIQDGADDRVGDYRDVNGFDIHYGFGRVNVERTFELLLANDPGGPEVMVQYGSIGIHDGDRTPSIEEGTDFGSVHVSTGIEQRTYRVTNTGESPLSLGEETSSSNEFQVRNLTSSLAPGDSDTFTITFNPRSVGPKSAIINFTTNDAVQNPFSFEVSGSGFEKLADIKAESIVFSDSSHHPGDEILGIEYCLTNLGPDRIGGNSRSGEYEDFKVSFFLSTDRQFSPDDTFFRHYFWRWNEFDVGQKQHLDPGSDHVVPIIEDGSYYLIVEFDHVLDAFSDPNISNNWVASSVPIRVGASVAGPEIVVEDLDGTNIPDNDRTPSTDKSTFFGIVDHETGSVERTYKVWNTGGVTLSLGGESSSNPSEFTISGLGSSISPGKSDTFKVRFNPSSEGRKTAIISFRTNDIDEDPFDFEVAGDGESENSAQPTVSNVRAQQFDGTKSVEILYDLAISGASVATVSLKASRDNGATYEVVPAESLSGAVGNNQSAGSGKSIVWDAGSIGWEAALYPQARVRVTATVAGGAPSGMVLVEGGELSTDDELDGTAVNSFYMGSTEITWGEWKSVRNWAVSNGYDLANSGEGCTDNHPVHSVQWHDVVKWCNAKSEIEELTPVYILNGSIYKQGYPENHSDLSMNYLADGFRLPLEVEWLFAASGGNLSKGHKFSGSDDLRDVGWNMDNSIGADCDLESGRGTWPVAHYSKLPNELGLHDMSGNVWEYCWDSYYEYGLGLRTLSFVSRGGSWRSQETDCNVLARVNFDPGFWDQTNQGFRVVRSVSMATELIYVEGGTLSTSNELDGTEVASFYIGRTEVTWAEWKEVLSDMSSSSYDIDEYGPICGDSHPVLVFWFDVLKWCNAKSELEGLEPVYKVNGATYRAGEFSFTDYEEITQDLAANGYRVPQDAEWEFAARGGNLTNNFHYSGSNNLNEVGWFRENSDAAGCDLNNGSGTSSVAQMLPNELGLYDMSGNVWEWVWPPEGFFPTGRGGGWGSIQEYCSVANRTFGMALMTNHGFRIARSASH